MSLPSSLRLKQQPKQISETVESPFSLRQKEKLPSSLKPKKTQQFPFENENDLEREIERNIAQGTSRIGETLLGLPGDLVNFVGGLFGKDVGAPGSQTLREISEKVSQGYTKPKSEFEERSSEVLQDISSFMIPGSPKYNLVRNIGIPVVANLVKEGIKYSGSEKLGDSAKIGTMIALDLMNLKGGGAKKFATDLFNQSEKLVPEGATLVSPKLQKSLMSLEKSLESGGSAPSKEKALKKLSEIQSKMKNGEIEVKELIDFRKTINEIKSELGGFEVQLPKHIKKKAIANLELVKKEVINGLNEYGSMKNPEFLKLNKAANESYAAYETSDKMGKFIRDKTKGIAYSLGLKSLFGLGATYGALTHPMGALKTAAIAIPTVAGYEGYKILHQVMQSPILRKYYAEILKGAASGNASQVTRNMKSLDKALEDNSEIK